MTPEIERLIEGVHLFGVKTVSGSAKRELLDSIDAACRSAGFRFGIHSHYFANRKFLYESPDDVLAAVPDPGSSDVLRVCRALPDSKDSRRHTSTISISLRRAASISFCRSSRWDDDNTNGAIKEKTT